MKLVAPAASVHDHPLAIGTRRDGHGLHEPATPGAPVARRIVQVATPQTDRTVVPVTRTRCMGRDSETQCPHRKEELKNGFDMGWSLVAGPARMGSVAKASLPSGSTDGLAALSGARRDARQGTRADRRGVQAR